MVDIRKAWAMTTTEYETLYDSLINKAKNVSLKNIVTKQRLIEVGNSLGQLWGRLNDIWKRVFAYFYKKNLAVLGAKAVGKTTLIEFLRTGSVPETPYAHTQIVEDKKIGYVELQSLSLRINTTADMPGGERRIGWEENFGTANVSIDTTSNLLLLKQQSI